MPHVFYFGMPTFNIMAILTMFLVLLVGIVESTGVYFAVSDICKEVDEKDLSKGYRAEGLAILLGGFLTHFLIQRILKM